MLIPNIHLTELQRVCDRCADEEDRAEASSFRLRIQTRSIDMEMDDGVRYRAMVTLNSRSLGASNFSDEEHSWGLDGVWDFPVRDLVGGIDRSTGKPHRIRIDAISEDSFTNFSVEVDPRSHLLQSEKLVQPHPSIQVLPSLSRVRSSISRQSSASSSSAGLGHGITSAIRQEKISTKEIQQEDVSGSLVQVPLKL